MNEFWNEISTMILLLVPFVLLCLINIKLNFPKKSRYKQVLYPVLAVIYCVVGIVYLDKIGNLLLSGIYFLIKRFDFLSFLDGVNWSYIITYVINIVLLIGFIAIKWVLSPFMVALTSSNGLVKLLCGWFYVRDESGDDEEDKEEEQSTENVKAKSKNEKDDKKNAWYVKKSMGDVRRLFFTMYITAVIVSSLLLLVTYYMVSANLFSAPFYPVFGILVLGEICFFLSGKTKREKIIEDNEEEIPEEKTDEINYESLVESYEKSYGSRLIEKVVVPRVETKDESAEQLLEKYNSEYEQTYLQEANLMYRYFSAMSAYKTLDDGLLIQTRNILDGKSVLFFTQFYEDTTDYVFLPVLRKLMRGHKVLIILGRNGVEDSVARWFERGLASVNGVPGIWKVSTLAESDEDTSIAILSMKDVYNQKMLATKEAYLAETSMVFIMEPTKLLSTMQIGLSCVVSMLKKGQTPQYIAYDRNCDGLVDSLSHVLNTSIEQVSATVAGTADCQVLYWEVDGKMLQHKLGLDTARYLGVGTELSTLALRDGASKVIWAAYDKFPVIDMRWISSQYYTSLCKVIKMKASQNALSERMHFTNDVWSIAKQENAVLVVEDEYNNAFETSRQFATRGEKQELLHVLCQNYWLRDYMTGNEAIFRNDPKSIPNFAADYQRSTANTVYKIIMRLIAGPVAEDEIRNMMEFIDINTGNVFKALCDMIRTYYFRCTEEEEEDSFVTAMIENALKVDSDTVVNNETLCTEKKHFYSIQDKAFVDNFLSQLKIIYYLAEDENDTEHYLGSVLYGHVYQKYLPGMFITLDGKYYEIVSMTKHNGVLVRRAADHITGRRYYRMLRSYTVDSKEAGEGIGTVRTYGNITFEHCEADIKVDTFGYLESNDYGNIKNAKKILINNIDERSYRNKEIIRIRMENSTPEVRYTVATLLNELFVTTFPDSYQYITATTHVSNPEICEGYIPQLAGEDDGYIYIIEDSLIDLGLLINIDRYFIRFLEIICDVLTWHTEKLAEENEGSDEGVGEGAGGDIEGGAEGTDEEEQGKGKKKRNIFVRFFGAIGRGIKGFFKKLFGGKKKKKSEYEYPENEYSENEYPEAEQTDNNDNDHMNGWIDGESPEPKKSTARSRVDLDELRSRMNLNGSNGVNVKWFDSAYRSGEDDYDDDSASFEGEDSEFVKVDVNGLSESDDAKKTYAQRHFLLYGYESVPEQLDIESTLKYFAECNLDDNYLKQSRDGIKRAKLKWYNYSYEPGVHYCDFCGARMEDGFDILNDGRERCPECAAGAINKLSDFKKLYKHARSNMEKIFGIKIKTKIRLRMTTANEIASEFGSTFNPTSGFDVRVLGFARRGRTCDIYIENGSPRIETEKTLIHEMTHTWQYENLPDIFQGNYDKVPVEGMAVWAEIQYLYCMGMEDRADDYMRARAQSSDEYGVGMLRYLEKYPIVEGSKAGRKSPFRCKKNPLD